MNYESRLQSNLAVPITTDDSSYRKTPFLFAPLLSFFLHLLLSSKVLLVRKLQGD